MTGSTLGYTLTMGNFTRLYIDGSIPLLAGPPLHRNTVTGWIPGQVAGGEPCGGPAISLQYTTSLVQWVNRLLPVSGLSGSHPRDGQTHNRTRFLLLALSHYNDDIK